MVVDKLVARVSPAPLLCINTAYKSCSSFACLFWTLLRFLRGNLLDIYINERQCVGFHEFQEGFATHKKTIVYLEMVEMLSIYSCVLAGDNFLCRFIRT